MALSIKKVGEIRRTVTIPFDGDDLNVTYRLSAINMALSDWMQEHGGERGSLMEWIERVVVEWDLLEYDDGPHLPVTIRVMETMPTPVLSIIMDTVYENASPKALRESWSVISPSPSVAVLNGTH